jgi:hypothetical protein
MGLAWLDCSHCFHWVGWYKLANSVDPYSMKAPGFGFGFNPRTCHVKTRFQSSLSKCSVRRYAWECLSAFESYNAVGLCTLESS